MARKREPRTVILEALTDVRKHTLMLMKIWKNRNVALTSSRWEEVAKMAKYLRALFDGMVAFAEEMQAVEMEKENAQ